MDFISALQYVTSGLTLVAFLGLVIFYLLKDASDKQKRLIELANPEDRSQLIDRLLTDGLIDVSNMTKAQHYQLAMEQLNHRTRRHQAVLKTLKYVFTIFMILTAITITLQSQPVVEQVHITGKVVDSNHRPLYGAKVTVDGHDFSQSTRSSGIFQGNLDNAIEKGSYITINVLLRGYLTETFNIVVNSDTIQLHTVVLRKPNNDAQR